MSDTYYESGVILSHICPVCEAWCLEAPNWWDGEEINELLGEHFTDCQFRAWGLTP